MELRSLKRQTLRKDTSGTDSCDARAMEGRVKEFEKEREAGGKPVSPSLAQLKNQQHHVATRRRELIAKHLESKSKPPVGGGVTMWPAMDDMRLSRNDVIFLSAFCLALILCTCATVIGIHGDTMTKLTRYTEEMRGFGGKHRLTFDNASFRESVLTWHRDLSTLMDKIDRDLIYSWSEANFFDWMLCLLYTCGITALLWHLYDNVLAKNRLTPRRIKAWISLLVAVLVLTSLGLYFLVKAHLLEEAIQKTVRNFIKEMNGMDLSSLDLTHYYVIEHYWTVLYLPPMTPGVLNVFGIVQVTDVIYYLQYYSLPIWMAIFLPIVKVIASLRAVYSI